MIKIIGLFKKYGKKMILNNINLEIKKGEKIAIIGPNGSGKTTLCEIIAGKTYDKGRIDYAFNNKELAYNLTINFQEQRWPANLKVKEIIHLFKSIYFFVSETQFQKCIKEFDIEIINQKMVSTLSGGEMQRFNLFISFFSEPKIFIGDEITSNLDIINKLKVIKYIKKRKKLTLIIVTHNWDEITELCERIIFIKNGSIVNDLKKKELVDSHINFLSFFKTKIN